MDPNGIDGLDAQFIGLTSPTAPRIQAGGHPCQGIYWTLAGQRPKVAVIATHYNVDFSEHYIAPYFARQGIGFLGWNTRYRGFEDQFLLEHAVLDIGVGMRWLKERAGVEAIVILGNSGGGSLMGAYQAEAIKPTLGTRLNSAGEDALHQLVKGDLYISFNAHQGRPEVLTDWMDASVLDETDPVATDPALDPFNPDNGPPYSDEFITRYNARSGKSAHSGLLISGSQQVLFDPAAPWTLLVLSREAAPALLARGLALPQAVVEAKAWLIRAIAAAEGLGVGHGIGPVHHFHALWPKLDGSP